MENVTNKSINQSKKVYCKLLELPPEDFSKLPVCTFSIHQNERKNAPGIFYFQMHIKLHDTISFNFDITEAEFFLIQLAYKQMRGMRYYTGLRTHYRLVSSKRDDGSVYIFFECLPYKNVYRSAFLSEQQIELIRLYDIKLNIETYDQIRADSIKPYSGEGQGA